MAYQRFTDRYLLLVRRWQIGQRGPDDEQLPLPGMPEPPVQQLVKVLPYILSTYANQDGQEIRPGKDNLARITGSNQRTIRRALNELEALGLIARVGSTVGGRGNAQEWMFTIPAWLEKGGRQTPLSVAKGGSDVHKRGAVRPPHHSLTGNGPASARRKGRAPAADNPTPELPRCDFADDGSGITCQRCNLPATHPRHRQAS